MYMVMKDSYPNDTSIPILSLNLISLRAMASNSKDNYIKIGTFVLFATQHFGSDREAASH
jgi:hypothetical protein